MMDATPEQRQFAELIGNPEPQPVELDFDSDTPLVCNRDQSGDTTCESCQ